MNKAILIDSKNETVTEIEIKDWTEITKNLECQVFTCVGLDQENNATLYVDDEGLLTLTNESKLFTYEGAYQPYAGNGLILGTDHEGESTDSPLTVDEVKAKVSFKTIHQVRNGE